MSKSTLRVSIACALGMSQLPGMIDESPSSLPDEVATLRQQRQDLLSMINANRDSIARCEEMVRRVDQMLEKATETPRDNIDHLPPARRSLLERLALRKAS